MRLQFFFLLAAIPLCYASLIGVSTLPSFRCVDATTPSCATKPTQPLQISAVPTLLNSLVSHSANADLHVADTTASARVIAFVTSPTLDEKDALSSVATAIKAVSSFVTDIDRPFAGDLQGAVALEDVTDEMIADETPRLVTLHGEKAEVMAAVADLAKKTDGNLAVVWTLREEEAGEKKDTDAGAGTNSTENAAVAGLPEITEAQFTGLLVFLLFLTIFIPGFLCLWNIQPPETFEILDSADAAKKMQ